MLDSGGQSSHGLSFRSSDGTGNNNHHSSLVTFTKPTGVTQETAPTESKTPPHDDPLRPLVYLNKPELPVLLLGAISSRINGAVLPTFGVLLSGIVRTFYEPETKLWKASKFWSLMFVALATTSLVATLAQLLFFAVAGGRLIRRIRSKLFDKVVHMEVGWFDYSSHSSGAIGGKLSADAATVRSLVGDKLALMAQHATAVIAGLAIAFAACWQLALIILALMPLIGLNGWIHMLTSHFDWYSGWMVLIWIQACRKRKINLVNVQLPRHMIFLIKMRRVTIPEATQLQVLVLSNSFNAKYSSPLGMSESENTNTKFKNNSDNCTCAANANIIGEESEESNKDCGNTANANVLCKQRKDTTEEQRSISKVLLDTCNEKCKSPIKLPGKF